MMTIAERAPQAPAIFAHIRDRFRESNTDDSIYITCPFTGRDSYAIYPEGGLQPAGYYIEINGEVEERDPLRNNIASLETAKGEIAVRMALAVCGAEEVVRRYNRIAGQASRAA